MKVYGNNFEQIRPDRANSGTPSQPRGSEGTAPGSVPPASPAPRSDSVEFSDRGRSLAARPEGENGVFDPERVAELRRKVYQGAYNSLDVVDQVARRILTRGDL